MQFILLELLEYHANLDVEMVAAEGVQDMLVVMVATGLLVQRQAAVVVVLRGLAIPAGTPGREQWDCQVVRMVYTTSQRVDW